MFWQRSGLVPQSVPSVVRVPQTCVSVRGVPLQLPPLHA